MRPVLLMLMLSFLGKLKANTYYFSSSLGDDQRSAQQAQSPLTPWQSLQKLNTLINYARPGDSILFKCGDTFYGSLTISTSGLTNMPLVFASYGNGASPIISGFTTLPNWTSSGKNIFTSTSSSFNQTLNVVVVNGQVKRLGRYPNTGFLEIESAVGSSQITDNQLSASPNYTYGDVVIRKNRWIIDRNFITSHSGNTINYVSESSYPASPNFGYFIQNHYNTLDIDGEWYFDKNKREIGIFLPSGNPASYDIKLSVVNTLININNKSNVVFDNISFEGANTNTFEIAGSQNIAISNCKISFSGLNAINAAGSANLSITNSIINYTNNIALNLSHCSNTILRNNKIACTGVFAGMGKGGDGTYEALLIDGDNNVIESNIIDSTGYIPISFAGNNVTIKNNFISNFALVKDDGGGIYTWNNSPNAPLNYGRKIVSNIIINGKGAGEGTDKPHYLPAHGIYMDDNVSGVQITSNSVANCGGYGIYLHNAHELTLNDNTSFNNGQQVGLIHDNVAANSPIKNISMLNNIFFSKEAISAVAEFKTIKNDLNTFGSFDSNFYCRPVDDNLTINMSYFNNSAYTNKQVNLTAWKTVSGTDINSRKTGTTLASYKINSLIGSNKFANGSFDANSGGLYIWSAAGNSSVSWVNGKLDGGALQISFKNLTGTTNRASVIIGIGAVTANKTYVLRYTSLGTDDNKSIEMFLRKSGADYRDLSDRKFSSVSASRKENELVFTPTISETDASIVLNIEEQDKPLYLDNIQLYEASVSPVDLDDNISFVYNGSGTRKTLPLDGSYVDVKNNTFSGSITLDPYTSVILVRQMGGAGNPANPSSNCFATGTVLTEQWNNIAGNNISDIPLQKTPDKASQITVLEYNNIGDTYARRIRGFICPPQSGKYTFLISGDDAAEFWLSTDDNPGNKVRIASISSWTNFREWDKFTSQRSAPIHLNSGQSYYLEVLHKEGTGGDNLSVAWQLPSGSIEVPIAASHLSPYQVSAAGKTDQIINFPQLTSKTYGDPSFALPATASSGLPVSYVVISGPAIISGSKLSLTGVGNVVITALQVGDNFYNSASPVTRSFLVAPASTSKECSATGEISFEQWQNVAGNDVDDIPLKRNADKVTKLSSFEITNLGDSYGSRLTGYICPSQTGSYTFFIAGDDAAELWLSTDNTTVHKVKIAEFLSWTNLREWDKFPSQKSQSVYLQSGKPYYIEVLHKNGAGGDHLSVGWQLPDGIIEAPIPGSHLSPYLSASASRVLNSKVSISMPQKEAAKKEDLRIFPNPFKTSTKIIFTPKETGNINISLRDIQGRFIQNIFHGNVKPGELKSIIIKGDRLPSGSYYVHIVTEKEVINKRVVIER